MRTVTDIIDVDNFYLNIMKFQILIGTKSSKFSLISADSITAIVFFSILFQGNRYEFWDKNYALISFYLKSSTLKSDR